MSKHFWFGEWLDDNRLDEALQGLDARLALSMEKPLPFNDLIQAAQLLSDNLVSGNPVYDKLLETACQTTKRDDAVAVLNGIGAALSRKAMMGKIRSELGCSRPGVLSRKYPGRQFEAWFPIGCVTHVMPSNVFSVAALGLVESLMAGNVNLVKISARDTEFAAVFADLLCGFDPGGCLKNFIAVAHISSKDRLRLDALFRHADAVSVWGGEKAVAAVRDTVPEGVKVVAWGHKVSFGYIAAECLADRELMDSTITGVATDVCRLDQQACSSPQTVFVEADAAGVEAFALKLAEKLGEISPAIPGQTPDSSEQAEITAVVSVARAEEALGLTRVIEDKAGQWRVIADFRPGLKPSPLFRTIWVKGIARADILTVLRPMRAWLQTCGLACGLQSLAPLSRALFNAGVTRVARPGEMVDSYVGAPHDGVYALQQLARRISLDGPEAVGGIGSFAELETPAVSTGVGAPIMHKAEFQERAGAVAGADLLFRSGGSSGKTVFSAFSWDDYHDQMAMAAHGLAAAGLDPERDSVINLFAAGHLYGSFISFWTILENLRARQLPMGMLDDYGEIAETIVDNKVNVIIGVPSHIIALFNKKGEKLKGVVQKIFYGGEKMTRSQRDYLTGVCGVTIVKSAVYGSNDAGPMGYQCPFCEGGEHHLMSAIQRLEIVDIEEDKPVAPGQTGRLIFTSSAREYPPVIRYEIGDTGRWLGGACPCGRADPRFELQGRTGDVFKAGAPFFNYRRFVDILDKHFNYAGPVQINIMEDKQSTVLQLRVNKDMDAGKVDHVVREEYEEIGFSEDSGLAFRFEVRSVEEHEFERVAASGKIRPVCEHRS